MRNLKCLPVLSSEKKINEILQFCMQILDFHIRHLKLISNLIAEGDNDKSKFCFRLISGQDNNENHVQDTEMVTGTRKDVPMTSFFYIVENNKF